MRVWTQLNAVYQEIDVMKDIQHQNCIRLYEVIEDNLKEDEEGADD